MSDKAWKVAERLGAKIIGGRRVYQKFSAGDAESDAFVADVKRRKAYSQREMREDLEKLGGNAEVRGRTPVLILVDIPGRGRKAGAPLVVMTAEDFQSWHSATPAVHGLDEPARGHPQSDPRSGGQAKARDRSRRVRRTADVEESGAISRSA